MWLVERWLHRLKSGRNQYATRPEHMPDRLKAVRDIREPDSGGHFAANRHVCNDIFAH